MKTKYSGIRLLAFTVVPKGNILRDAPVQGKSFSLSRCWNDVQTGHVRNKASSFLQPGQTQIVKSPAVKVRVNC